jgi:hypothetical protein
MACGMTHTPPFRVGSLILVVGGRYGSVTDSGKSVTNLEYFEAKAKGIPCYVFVQKPILNALPIWRKNKSGNFSDFVDSPKLFEFVESLRDSKEVWVFPFDYAQDITGTLRTQLAYLFKDALAIRTKILHSGLSDALKDLSGAALLLAVQRPLAWEYRLFGQVMSDEISRLASVKKDLNYGLSLGQSLRLGDPAEVTEWLQRKIGELKLFIQSLDTLINTGLPKALGAPGEPGNVEDLVYVGKRIAEVYRSILEWTVEFRRAQVDKKFSRLLELVPKMSYNLIEEIEVFVANYNQQIDDAKRRYE